MMQISRRKKTKRQTRKRYLLFLILPLVILFLVIFFFKTSLWDGKSKFSLVVAGKEEVKIKVFDPKSETILEMIIPGDTQVQVAGNLGSWKLKSVWQLGLNEGRPGELLAKTVAKNFGFPVFAWVNEKDFKQTNLRLGDWLRLLLFEFKVDRNQRLTLNLRDFSEFLKEKTLLDGSRGYVIFGKVPLKIAALFAEEDISNRNLKVRIVIQMSAGDPTPAVAQIIEMLGAKVVSITKEDPGDFTCLVASTDQKLRKVLARIFACQEEKQSRESNFDIEIKLGSQFTRNF